MAEKARMTHHEQQGALQRPPPFEPWTSMVVAADVMTATNDIADGLAARKASRLANLVAYASRRSPLYRRLLGAHDDAASIRLRDLPVMRKSEPMRNFADWVTDPALRVTRCAASRPTRPESHKPATVATSSGRAREAAASRLSSCRRGATGPTWRKHAADQPRESCAAADPL
jgi:hypothetical protein